MINATTLRADRLPFGFCPTNLAERGAGLPAVVAENTLDRKFEVEAPDVVLVTDIKTHEGWSYLAVVIDLFSRRAVGWSPSRQIASQSPAGQ